MAQLFVNNANSKLVAGISNVSLSLQIAAGDGMKFPNPTGGDFFLVTLSKITSGIESSVEIVKVTARATDVFTIVRAQEGTTALAYAENDTVSLRVTAGVINSTEVHKNSVVNPHSVTKAQVALGNADNTSDADKPVSTAQQTALNLKANLASPTFTGTVSGITAAMVGAQPAGTYATGGGTATGTNTGDQTSIAGITGTLAQFNTAVTDADLVSLAGVETLTNKTITDTVFTLTGTTPAFTATNGAVQTWTLSGASTPTNALTTGQSIILVITPGAFAITWPSVVWTKQGGSGAAPTLFSAGKTSVVLWMVGAVLYGSHLGDTV